MTFFVINIFALYYFNSFSTKIHITSMQKYILAILLYYLIWKVLLNIIIESLVIRILFSKY